MHFFFYSWYIFRKCLCPHITWKLKKWNPTNKQWKTNQEACGFSGKSLPPVICNCLSWSIKVFHVMWKFVLISLWVCGGVGVWLRKEMPDRWQILEFILCYTGKLLMCGLEQHSPKTSNREISTAFVFTFDSKLFRFLSHFHFEEAKKGYPKSPVYILWM